MNNQVEDVAQVVMSAEPSTMIFSRVFIDTGWYTALMMHEDPEHILAGERNTWQTSRRRKGCRY